ncbi:hypothetical protein G4228_015468 [Cervus hanglu yarkandensis]|nr:hypothetical protein G4228_015468 [Cervus hanglu yarkandensis]
MALTVCVRRLTGLPGTHDRQVRLSFRVGFTQKTRRIHHGREADIGELFCWPHYGAPLAGECLSVQVVNCSRVFSPRSLGILVISLQQLQTAGHLVLQEALVEKNLRVSPVQVELDLKYQPPEGAAGVWTQENFGAPIRDSSELIIPNVGFQELEPGEAQLERQAVALGRRLARGAGQQDNEDNELELELKLDDEPDVELSGVVFSPLKSRARGLACGDPFQVSRAQDFQVGVTVLEAQKLVGVNNNPYVAVRVGEQRRVTATQRGTNCPFYNEYFLFEFHETRLHLQNLLLEITTNATFPQAFHSQTLPFMATRIGTFRMDLGMIFDQPECPGSCEDFLLFAVLFEATMIDPAVAAQPISFEISIGDAGYRKEKLSQGSRAGEEAEDTEGEEQLLLESDMGVGPVEEEELGTPAQRPELMDGSGPYFCLPLHHRKPCVSVWSRWENHLWRLQSSNCVRRVAERLDQGLQEVETLQRRPGPGAFTRLKQALKELVAGSRRAESLPFLAADSENLLAKQGLWLLWGLSQRNVPEKVALAKKLLVKLRFLAQEAPGAAPGEVCAKLELFLWLGLGKQDTACTAELPVDLLPESSAGLPQSLYRDNFSYFQLRAHLYQTQGVLAADDSGLSDPFARVLISTQCQTMRVLEQKLSPLWDELLVFDQPIVDGRREHLQYEPPPVIVNVFDHSKFVPDVFLGRALPAPRVKLMEDPYQRPELQFFPLRKGPQAAGELIATFELIELDYSRGLEPSVPSDVKPQDLTLPAEPLSGRLSCRPTQVQAPESPTSQLQVLFLGLRGLGRVHLLKVEQPQVVPEVAGRRVESEVLASYCENPNFTELVKHLTVDLPEQPYLQPPLSVLVIKRRAFGRTVFVGSHVVPHMLRFTLRGQEDAPEEQEEEEAGDLVPKEPQGQRSLDPFRANMGTLRQFLKANFDEDEMDDPGDSDGVHPISVDGEAHDQSEPEVKGSVSQKKALATLKIYNTTLEEEFDHFEDWLNVFPCTVGRGVRVEMERMKGLESLWASSRAPFLIYPESEAVSFSEPQISWGIPQNQPIKFLVRVYVVKATNLAPEDPNGKADPYVVVSVGRERLDPKERYIPKQLNLI